MVVERARGVAHLAMGVVAPADQRPVVRIAQVWAPPAATEGKVRSAGDFVELAGVSRRPSRRASPSARIAQVWLPPAETAWNSPAGTSSSWPAESSPQQARVPSAAIAQVCLPPAETAMNWPLGASLTWPAESSPQQARSPPTSIAQVWVPPAETEGVESSAGCDGGRGECDEQRGREQQQSRESRRTVPLNPSFHRRSLRHRATLPTLVRLWNEDFR